MRLLRLLAVPVVAVATVATAPQAAAAPQAAPQAPPAVTQTAPATITLITGDKVTVRTNAGRTAVDVTPRPGNESFTYTTEQGEDGYFLFPSDAAPLVASGVLDRQLFNVNYLAENGYADDVTAALPVIVQYDQGLKASAVPGATGTLSLPSINGAALDVAKDQAGEFWAQVSGAPAARAAGVRKVWLDAKVKALDETANAQIGAPAAWAAGHDGTGATVGVIDTGVDGTHPDLADRVVAARNFVEAGFPGGGKPEDVTDRHGHGTHVASTVAGSGAASAGRYTGVAPGTKLVIAKALDDNGSGLNSSIIAAMEWQAAQQVDVISMSLGGGPTDGTDPLSTAVNELTAQYGTLFVIAAGNFGADFTVAAPGAATSALTVGAVDADDRLADFSSRGPRLGDMAIKPEIAAPGVGIVAARAAGTAMGRPLDDRYTASSGTSMATPHVAAAAGILAAAHEDWTPEQLKAALVGTSKDVGLGVYEQGAGRLDLGRAATRPVFDDVSSISARVSHPYDGQAVTRTVTYRNTGSAPVTLDLSVALSQDGTPAPAGMATVSKPSVTVEPGATASIDVTLDPTVATPGWYEGRLTAAGGADHLAVPIALWLQAEQDTVRLQLVGDPGWMSMTGSFANTILTSDDDPLFAGEPIAKMVPWRATGQPHVREATVSLARGGTYSLTTNVSWSRADREIQFGQVVVPEVTVDGDRTVVLDATELTRVNVATEQPSEPVSANHFYYRTTAAGRLFTGGSVLSYPVVARNGGYWISPSATAPRIGKQGFISDETRIAPQVTLRAPGLSVHPHYVTDRFDVLPKFDRDRGVGFATEQDLRAGKNVRGKLVYLTPAPLETFLSDVDLAVAGGAAGVLTNNHLAWVMTADVYAKHMAIPLLWVNSAETAQLADGLPRSATLGTELVSPYEYKAVHYFRDRIPARIDIRMRDRDLAKVDTTYHARFAPLQGKWGPVPAFTEAQHTFNADQILSVRGVHAFVAPGSRVEYYTVPDDVLWNRGYTFRDAAADADRNAVSWRGFTRGSREKEDWNGNVMPAQTLAGPALPANNLTQFLCDNCRQGDRLRLRSLGSAGFALFTDADPSHEYGADLGATEEIHLYRDGTELTPAHDAYGLPYYDVPAEPATYRLTDKYTSGFAGPHGAQSVTTDWTFRSGRPAASTVATPYACIDSALFNDKRPCAWQPLPQLSYDLDVAADDTARAGRPFAFTVRARVGEPVVALRDLKVWISSDGGKTWKRTTVTRAKDNAYRASVTNPRGAAAITIKAEATDRDGNSVRHTVTDAYLVR